MEQASPWWPHDRFEADLDEELRDLWSRAQGDAAAGRHDEAARALRNLLAKRPDFVPAMSKLGAVLALQGRTDEARFWIDQALAQDPRYPPALNNKGNLLLDAGDVEGAMAYYRAALAVDEQYTLARSNLAVALKRRGDYEGFVREMKRARHGYVRRHDSGGQRAMPFGCLPVLVAASTTLALLVVVGCRL